MDWQNKKVLVTGAGGFIGSHLTEHLVHLGADVRAMVHYNALGSWSWLDQSDVQDEIDVVAGDIIDRDSVRSAMEDCEMVFHLAALIAIPYSYRAPMSYVRTNIEGSINVFQAARELGTEKIIQTSTSETYGSAIYTPIDEKHPLQGQSPYSASKIGADMMAQAFYQSFDVPVATIRPFNTFGPRQSARAVIPTIITQCLTQDKIKLGNIYPRRDMNYVANTVSGFVAVAESPESSGEIINIGYGEDISIGDLAQMIARLMDKSIDIETDEKRLRPEGSEVDRLLADVSRANDLLGWQPQVSLEQGLQKTIEWVSNHLERYRPGVYIV
ncbi:MAG: SDR family NAD(P)-dependent oxidoreductase [Aggregatilineales bacterium]